MELRYIAPFPLPTDQSDYSRIGVLMRVRFSLPISDSRMAVVVAASAAPSPSSAHSPLLLSSLVSPRVNHTSFRLTTYPL